MIEISIPAKFGGRLACYVHETQSLIATLECLKNDDPIWKVHKPHIRKVDISRKRVPHLDIEIIEI